MRVRYLFDFTREWYIWHWGPSHCDICGRPISNGDTVAMHGCWYPTWGFSCKRCAWGCWLFRVMKASYWNLRRWRAPKVFRLSRLHRYLGGFLR